MQILFTTFFEANHRHGPIEFDLIPLQEAARKVGMPKARKGRLSMSHAGTREAVERGEAIPRNTRIPLKILRGIRGSLKKK